jgi:thioredoxin reductase (NADPH)
MTDMQSVLERSLQGERLAQALLPVVFVIDRDQHALDSLISDLTRRFGHDFTVTGTTSRAQALEGLAQLASARRPVALLVADDDEPDGLLTRAHELHPQAKRVLLVNRDYSSTSPVVQAMTLGRVDYHIVRPWASDETMYRAMSEYLASWTRSQEPKFEEFQIVASESDPRGLQLRDVMTRFNMSFKFYAAETEIGKRLLNDADLDETRDPVLIRYDGQVMMDPSMPDLATAIGVSIQNDVASCELAIVGAGPAGLTAAVYAASEGLETVLLEQRVSGGQAGSSPLIRNYPGFPHGIDGGALMERTCEQAWLMGAHIVFAQQAVGLERHGDERVLRQLDGAELRARAVLIAPGIEWRRLGVPGLEDLVGAGVFYGAAVSESRAMQDQHVFIVGAGNSAGQAALHLAKHAQSVSLVVRGDALSKSMSNYLVRAIESTPNIVVRLRTEVVGGGGAERLEYLKLARRGHGASEQVPAAALFIMIGGEPHTEWLPEEIARDRNGYLLTGRELLKSSGHPWHADREPLTLETSMPGVFAAGDARQGSIKRIASAVGDGATAVRLVHEYLSDSAGHV